MERGRIIAANQLLYDQADFFEVDGYTRTVGITTSQLVARLFFQNAIQPWTLVTGVGITDAQISAGKVYWNEIAGSPGFYSLRWRPDGVGYWRLVLDYAIASQSVILDYDVIPTGTLSEGGLRTSFIKTGC